MHKSTALLRANVAMMLVANNVSQTLLSEHLGVSKSVISKLLRGRRDLISMSHIDEIANYFSVEIHELFMPIKNPVPLARMKPFHPGTRRKETKPRMPKGFGSRTTASPAEIEEAEAFLAQHQPRRRRVKRAG